MTKKIPIEEKVADMLMGGGCDSEHWPEAVELAEEIIALVRAHDEGAENLGIEIE